MNNEQLYKQFGVFVKTARIRRGLYQKEIAERVGISQSYYSAVECGIRQVTLPVALDICEALYLDFGDFLQSVKEPPKRAKAKKNPPA